ncbi:MAG: zf-HC2 domain-containing protein [Myxococcota bacterium]
MTGDSSSASSCDWVGPRLSDYLDGELDAIEAWSVRRHLARCPACRGRYANLRRTVKALQAVGDRRRS